MLTNLCAQIIPIKDKFEWVVGIERGGLPISQWLSYALNKKHTSILISRYGDETHSSFIKSRFDTLPIGHPFLLVDDIVDSGGTIDYFKKIFQSTPYWVATLHWCEENSPHLKPDFYVDKKHKSEWIVYPWEENNS